MYIFFMRRYVEIKHDTVGIKFDLIPYEICTTVRKISSWESYAIAVEYFFLRIFLLVGNPLSQLVLLS